MKITAWTLMVVLVGCASPPDEQVTKLNHSGMTAISCMGMFPSSAGDEVIPPTPGSKVLIVSGQSNVCTVRDKTVATNDQPIPSVKIWINGRWETYQLNNHPNEPRIGPQHQFILNWVNDNPGQELAVIVVSFGNTTMGCWSPGAMVCNDPQLNPGSIYDLIIATWRASGGLTVMGWIHDQGQSDTRSNEAFQYETYMNAFFSNAMMEFNYPPLVMFLTHHDGPNVSVVNDAQLRYVSSQTNARSVDTSDLLLTDTVHRDTNAQIISGDRAYLAWKAI